MPASSSARAANRESTAIDARSSGGGDARIGDRIVDRSVSSLLQSIANRLYEVSV